ncbi:MAG TPA: hypothetical protein VNB23_11235 [Ramlibacter sp.]|nr:hypothetical protein [Ramlibacter sp.]
MRFASAVLATLASSVHAHPGHGMAAETHWHASDTWGFVALGALVLLAIWLSRGD